MGQCEKKFHTSSLAFEGLPSKPRGNTPAILVPAAFSNEPLDYYLGIAHVEANRSYRSFFYKMQVSNWLLQIKFHAHHRSTAAA
jgi:hypothetical protein